MRGRGGEREGRRALSTYAPQRAFRIDMMKGKRRWFQGQHLIGFASIYQNNLSFLFLFPTKPEIPHKVKKRPLDFSLRLKIKYLIEAKTQVMDAGFHKTLCVILGKVCDVS